jgi:predicted ABC-type ATPase
MSLNLSRIKSRVQSGGHNIPKESVIRRHSRVFDNFWNLYRPLSSSWYTFDNSGSIPILKMNNQNFEHLNESKKTKFVSEFLKGRVSGT